jgi:CelD/BcsL family acetyltransferase involved in cellulose biosynthesis
VTTTRASAAVRLETIETESAFGELGTSWDRLVGAMPRPSPFLLHTWLLEWLRHYRGTSRLAVQVAFRDGELAAALPFVVHSWRGLRIARFIGGRQANLADLLVDPREDASLGATLLAQASPGYDFAELFGLAADSRMAQVAGQRRLHLFQRIEAPVLDLDDDWDALYHAKVSGKHRSFHRRCRRQLEELGALEFAFARTRPDVERMLEEAFRVHALRWQGRPDASGFVTPTGMSFHRAAVGALADQDAVRLATMTLSGDVIAFVLCFVLRGRLFLYRLAFDPSFARFSPGLLTLLETIACAARDGVARLEFLGGGEGYKVRLADRLEPLHLGIGLPGSVAGRAAVAARVATLLLRTHLKHSAAARRAYDTAAPLVRRLRVPREVLRP